MIEINRDSVSTQVHRYLRDRIVHGELMRGTRLVEVDVAAELGVSRTPVREALWQLRSMNLVRKTAGGGYEVTDIRQELVDILDIRAALEAHAVRRAVERVDDAQIARIADICDRMERLPASAADQRAELNQSFHETLVSAAGNRRLLHMVSDYQSYFSVAQPMFDEGFVQRTQQDHRDILEALRARNADRAAELVTSHILGAAEFLKRTTTSPSAQTPGKES